MGVKTIDESILDHDTKPNFIQSFIKNKNTQDPSDLNIEKDETRGRLTRKK
jgi:hypothetical protein